MSEQLANEAVTTQLQPVQEQTAQPQTEWNPPVGDEDFDALFQRVGNDGESIADSNAIPVEPTTETTEPATQQTKPEPTAAKFELKTSTGTVYKDPEEAVRGIEQKDQLINQLRSMVAAVTGEDPLSKSGAKPGQTAQQKPVSYLQDKRRFAQDLTKAAEFGQTQDNWDTYGNVLGQYIYEVVQSAVGPYMPVVQNVGKQQALDDVSRGNPEFRNFYGSQEYQKVLEERPKLANFIQIAESQPTLQEELKEFYQSTWDHAQARRMPELVKQHQSTPNPTPRMPVQQVTRAPLTEPNDGMRRAAQPTGRPSLATPAGRKAIIEEAEAKGLADIQF